MRSCHVSNIFEQADVPTKASALMAPTAAMATILVREGIFAMIRMVLRCLLITVMVSIESSRGVPPCQSAFRRGGGTARFDDVVIKVQRLLLCSNLA